MVGVPTPIPDLSTFILYYNRATRWLPVIWGSINTKTPDTGLRNVGGLRWPLKALIGTRGLLS